MVHAEQIILTLPVEEDDGDTSLPRATSAARLAVHTQARGVALHDCFPCALELMELPMWSSPQRSVPHLHLL